MQSYSEVILSNEPIFNLLIVVSGCDHALAPARSLYLTTIVVFDTPTPNVSTYLLTGVVNGTTYNSEFKFNRTDQPVNSSFCHISSLEVYRGKEQAIEINHGGFSLSDSGNIEVHELI